MNCKISCSFGEIVDKVTILKIKQSKATDPNALQNIEKELTQIQKENPEVNKKDVLFEKLSKINKKLWLLEDSIREKSKKKEFDKQYIEYAESIHITNDQRYLVKKQINEKYNSNLKEEKVYNTNKIIVNLNDVKKLEIGKKLYTDGHYTQSMSCIEKIMKKYENYPTYDSFFIDLLFSYSNICAIFNKTFPYFNKIKEFMSIIDELSISKEQKDFCKLIYSTLCLSFKKYELSYKYIGRINYINGPNISFENMSFFKKTDTNKTLLIYDGGGLGDKFMLGRFIPKLCEDYKENKIVFFCDDKLVWFFNNIFKEISNIRIIPESCPYFLPKFDYHCSLLSLIKHLNITYSTLYSDTLIHNINVELTSKCKEIISSFNKPSYILNWKGNPKNSHEKHNRMMNLINAIPLFKISNIQWIVITRNITSQEKKILKKYNVKTYGNVIDKEKSFYDTISILRNVQGVVSTDTSLPHLSLSLRVKTYVLLTLGCEWRWTKDKTTNWYLDAILLRQKALSDWKDPINELKTMLLETV